MMRTCEAAPAGGRSRSKRRSSSSSRSSTWPAQRVGCLVSMASSTRRPVSATSSSSRSRVRTRLRSCAVPLGRSRGSVAPALPGAEVERRQLGELQGGDGAAAVGGAVDPPVVDADELAVRGQPDVALQGVRAVLDRLPVRGERVFGDVLGGSPMGDDLDRPSLRVRVRDRAGERHRAMVPPQAVDRACPRGAQLPLTAVRHAVGNAVST